MTKVQDYGFRSAFLKNYAMIKNVERLAYQQEGERLFVLSPNGINPYYTEDVLKKYFKIVEIKKGNSQTIGKFYSMDDYLEHIIQCLNGTFCLKSIPSITVFKTTDGSIIGFFTASYWPWVVYVDVNGAQRPNVVGRDVFLLEAHHNWNWEIVPVGTYTYGSIAPNTCKMNKSGFSCGAEIIKNKSFKIPKS